MAHRARTNKNKKPREKSRRWLDWEVRYLHESRRTEVPHEQIGAVLRRSEMACRLRLYQDKKRHAEWLAKAQARNTAQMMAVPAVANGHYGAVFGSGSMLSHATSFSFSPQGQNYYQPPPSRQYSQPRPLLPKPESSLAAQAMPSLAAPAPLRVLTDRLEGLALAATRAERAEDAVSPRSRQDSKMEHSIKHILN